MDTHHSSRPDIKGTVQTGTKSIIVPADKIIGDIFNVKQDNLSTVKYLTNFIDQGCGNLKFKKQIELSQKIINEAKSK